MEWDCCARFRWRAHYRQRDPGALKKAKPGTPEFRAALRDEIRSQRNVVGASGIYTFTEGNAYGVDDRAVITVQIKQGDWKLIDFVE